jgi:hypothetical protein
MLSASSLSLPLRARAALAVLEMAQSETRVSLRQHMAEVDPGPHLDWWHVGKMAEALQALIDGEILNLLISAPPRTYKSRTLQAAMSYRLRTSRESKIFLVGANDQLMLYHSAKARGMAQLAGVHLSESSRAKKVWETKEGGAFVATTVRSFSSVLGFGFDLGVVDDPFGSIHDARNPRIQREVWDFARDDFSTRRQARPDGSPGNQLWMFQRLSRGDLADKLRDWLEETQGERWHLLVMKGYAAPYGIPWPSCCTVIQDERKDGEPLCESPAIMREIDFRRRTDPMLSAAVDDQEPAEAPSGGVFCAPWYRQVGRELGDMSIEAAVVRLAMDGILSMPSRRARGWDLSAGGEDAVASARGSLCGDVVLWEDGTEAWPPSAKVEATVLDVARRDGTGVEQVIPLEPAVGKLAAERIGRQLTAEGFTVHYFPQRGPKRSRALGHAGHASATCEACGGLVVPPDAVAMFKTRGLCSCPVPVGPGYGKCYILARPFADVFLRRHHAFTGADGEDDHLVDASSACFSVLMDLTPEAEAGNFPLW